MAVISEVFVVKCNILAQVLKRTVIFILFFSGKNVWEILKYIIFFWVKFKRFLNVILGRCWIHNYQEISIRYCNEDIKILQSFEIFLAITCCYSYFSSTRFAWNPITSSTKERKRKQVVEEITLLIYLK